MKIDENFPHDIFQFLHRPIRIEDATQQNILERFLLGPQKIWEEDIDPKVAEIFDLWVPELTPTEALDYLKPHVGLTRELNNITNDLTESELRKVIKLSPPIKTY